jgi:glycosyltransferase involved in cell wall biosynthesis
VPRVAFVTPGFLPLLREKEGTVYGGSELRAWRFARGLAGIGFDVSIVGFDDEPVPTELLGLVSIVRPPTTNAWLTSLRRMLGTDGAAQSAPWRAADADVYIAFGVAEYNAALAEWCKKAGRPLILFAGSDADFSSDYQPGNTIRNIWGSRCDRCYASIMAATALVVQTEMQKRIAKERFSRDAELIANPVLMTSSPPDGEIGAGFLWIGKAVDNKRPELALTVAKACPDQSFVMILNDIGNGLFKKISDAKPPNVDIVTSVPPPQLEKYFARARALLCTSDFEGFPNTFLDAGRFGVPVLSLSVDPDGVISREQGGFIADGDIDRLIGATKRFAEESEIARAAGRRLYEYVRRRHEASGRVDELAGVVRRTIFQARSEVREPA